MVVRLEKLIEGWAILTTNTDGLTGTDMNFKNVNGVFYTKELFIELATNKANAVYTLKESEHNGYPSLYEAYMAADDITEYRFALDHLDGWSHWKNLQECNWFKPYLVAWREELEIRQRSRALANVMKAATEGRDTLAANRYLAEKGWEKTKTAGRPTKAAIQREAQVLADNSRRVDEDLARLQVN